MNTARRRVHRCDGRKGASSAGRACCAAVDIRERAGAALCARRRAISREGACGTGTARGRAASRLSGRGAEPRQSFHGHARATHASVLRMTAVVTAPPTERAVSQKRLRACAMNVVHPNLPAPTTKMLHLCVQACRTAKLPTRYRRIGIVPSIVTDSAPL